MADELVLYTNSEYVNQLRERIELLLREREKLDALASVAENYLEAWDRYANPAKFPDSGTEGDRITMRAKAHQRLIDAIRALDRK